MFQLTFDFTTASILLDSSEPFPVDFDRAWQWIGYSIKKDAKQFLLKNFELDLDYVVLQPELGTLDFPRPSEQIYITVDAFKTWGMMARTEQGKLVRKYFLECEKVAKGKINAANVELFLVIAQQKQQIQLLQSELAATNKIVTSNAKVLTKVEDLAHDTSRLVDCLLDRNLQLQSELDRLNHPYGKYYTVLGWLNIRERGINEIKQLAPSEVARIGKRCAAECEKRRITVEQVHDMRYGTVGAYPATIINNCIPVEFYI
jgi:phage anti-repressor protein